MYIEQTNEQLTGTTQISAEVAFGESVANTGKWSERPMHFYIPIRKAAVARMGKRCEQFNMKLMYKNTASYLITHTRVNQTTGF